MLLQLYCIHVCSSRCSNLIVDFDKFVHFVETSDLLYGGFFEEEIFHKLAYSNFVKGKSLKIVKRI